MSFIAFQKIATSILCRTISLDTKVYGRVFAVWDSLKGVVLYQKVGTKPIFFSKKGGGGGKRT